MISMFLNPPISAEAKIGSVETARRRALNFCSRNALWALLISLSMLWPSYASADAAAVLAELYGDEPAGHRMPADQQARYEQALRVIRYGSTSIVSTGGTYTRVDTRRLSQGLPAVESDGRVVIYANTVNVVNGVPQEVYEPTESYSGYSSPQPCDEEPQVFSASSSSSFLDPAPTFAVQQCEDMARNPIQANYISSGYGVRNDPFGDGESFHAGIDIPADEGTPIPAPAQAVVYDIFVDGADGNWIELEHNDGTITRYGHLSSFAVSKGDTVKVGDIIGYTGNTGMSTGPHLHYEIIPGGSQQIDPQFAALPASLENCHDQLGRRARFVRSNMGKFRNPRAIGTYGGSVRRGYFNYRN